jgi:hypothetical protein
MVGFRDVAFFENALHLVSLSPPLGRLMPKKSSAQQLMLYASTPRVSPALFLLIFATPSFIGGAQRKSTYIKTAQRAHTTVYTYVLVAFQIQKNITQSCSFIPAARM